MFKFHYDIHGHGEFELCDGGHNCVSTGWYDQKTPIADAAKDSSLWYLFCRWFVSEHSLCMARSFVNPDVFSVVLISIIRMVVTAQNSVQTSGTWVVAQINVAIVCACLPTYRPILPAPRVIINSLRTLILSVKGSLTLSSTTGHQSKNTGQNSHLPKFTNSRSRYRNLHDEDVVDKTHLTKAVGGADGYGVQDYPMNTIAVRNDIEVV